MAKNKGLTPKRKKIDRNPRVKHREKFRRAKIRRKGQVCIPLIDDIYHKASRDRLQARQFESRVYADNVKQMLFIFARSGMFVGRRRDTAERCLVFVLVSRRASNLSNQDRVQNIKPGVAMGWKKYRWTVLVNVYYR